MTLRRRNEKLLAELFQAAPPAWRQTELARVARAYRTPRILDQTIALDGYAGPLRQIAIRDLGHEEPTLLLTNQLRRSPVELIGRYAQRMLIENSIADGIDFFHMDALSSAVAMKVNCDLQLTLMASSLYRLLAAKIGHGYQHAKVRHVFRDFVEATAQIAIGETEIVVSLQKRAHRVVRQGQEKPQDRSGFDWTQPRDSGKQAPWDLLAARACFWRALCVPRSPPLVLRWPRTRHA
jgi:hypothetical protein